MFDLTEEYRAIQAMARDFARSEVMPGSAARDKSHEFPSGLVARLAELGLLGVFVPGDYGGSGLDILAYVVALEEISYADAGVGVVMSVQNSLAGSPILAFGTHEQKLAYLPDLASGKKIGCYALTEPGAGSDAAALRCAAISGATSFARSCPFFTIDPRSAGIDSTNPCTLAYSATS